MSHTGSFSLIGIIEEARIVCMLPASVHSRSARRISLVPTHFMAVTAVQSIFFRFVIHFKQLTPEAWLLLLLPPPSYSVGFVAHLWYSTSCPALWGSEVTHIKTDLRFKTNQTGQGRCRIHPVPHRFLPGLPSSRSWLGVWYPDPRWSFSPIYAGAGCRYCCC